MTSSAITRDDVVPAAAGHVALVLLYIFLWSSGFAPSRVVLREIPALWVLGSRLVIAGTILLVLARARGLEFPRTRLQWGTAVAVGVLVNVVYLGLLYVALHDMSSGMAAIIASTNPLILAFVAPALLSETPQRATVLGILIGFGGVAFTMWNRVGNALERPQSIAICFISVLGLVASTVVYKRAAYPSRMVMAATGVQLLVGSALLLPAAMIVNGAPTLPHTLAPWLSFGYLTLVMSVGASLLWFWLLAHGDATRLSAFYFLVPVFGLVIGHLLLGEVVTWRDALGAIVIAVGISLAQRTAVSA
ncbi:MAG TPA: EamA family transporter [Gemmatimonadaceae bacterium]